MLQRRSYAKRGRSVAQHSQISSLGAQRRKLAPGNLPGGLGCTNTHAVARSKDLMLVDRLIVVEQNLANTLKREKRAKENSVNSKDRLTALAQDTNLIQAALCNAEKTLDNSYSALEDLERQNTLLLERCTALEINESLIHEFCTELEAKETLLHGQIAETTTLLSHTRVNADHEIQALKKRTHQLELSKDADRKKLSRISKQYTRAIPHTLAAPHGELIAQEARLKDKQGSIRPVVRDLVRKLVADNHVGTEHISSIITNVTAAFNIIITDTISARSVSRIVLEGFFFFSRVFIVALGLRPMVRHCN
ncbi:hypothetical protein BDV93DRAFT_592127 [Ceratobasidium sp. AG-I]|nr:hypothetical protein BDV93DRAFT_592127 [Ceratobasidium sp. AG-I]